LDTLAMRIPLINELEIEILHVFHLAFDMKR